MVRSGWSVTISMWSMRLNMLVSLLPANSDSGTRTGQRAPTIQAKGGDISYAYAIELGSVSSIGCPLLPPQSELPRREARPRSGRRVAVFPPWSPALPAAALIAAYRPALGLRSGTAMLFAIAFLWP